eukprot:2217351-Rhodomonas_salina.1
MARGREVWGRVGSERGRMAVQVRARICLWACYAVSGTDVAGRCYQAVGAERSSAEQVAAHGIATPCPVLWNCYAVSGTKNAHSFL